MAKIEGNRVILMVKDDAEKMTAIAYTTEHELTIEADTIRKATTTSAGWDEFKKRGFSWRISMNKMISMVRGKVSIESLVSENKTVEVAIVIVASGGFDASDVEAEEVIVKGNAMFDRMTITGQQGAFAVMSVSLVGNGELLNA